MAEILVTWHDGWNAYGYDVISGTWLPLPERMRVPAG